MRLDTEAKQQVQKYRTRTITVLPSPHDKEDMLNTHVHALDVIVNPSNVADLEPDLHKIITLKHSVVTDQKMGLSPNSSYSGYKGYFSIGERAGDAVVFEVYAPHNGIKPPFPTKSLKHEVGQFILRLIETGYHVTGIDYKLIVPETKTK